MPKSKYIMTIEGLEIHPVEIDVTSFGLGSSTSLGNVEIRKPGLSEFTIQRGSDKWSPSLQRASIAGTTIQVSLRVDTEQEGTLLTTGIYTFSDAVISTIQYSGGGEKPTETVHFHFRKIEIAYEPDRNLGSLAVP